MKYLIWHITHGVQVSLGGDYAAKHIEKVFSYLDEKQRNYIIPIFTNWSALVEARQRRTWEMESDLSLSRLRAISVNIACDLLWYDEPWINDAIHAVHNLDLSTAIGKITSKGGEVGGVVRQGHSLGSQIMFDISHRSEHNSTGLITLGSPISKYSGKFKDWGSLPAGLKAWLNIYANRDLVSSSFKNHPRVEFRGIVEDFKAFSWNPLNSLLLRAHTFYWGDSSTCERIAKFLSRLLLTVNNIAI